MQKLVARLGLVAVLATVFAAGFWIWRHRLELFVLPAAMDRVIALWQEDPEGSDRLDQGLQNLLELQRPGFFDAHFHFERAQSLSGAEAFLVGDTGNFERLERKLGVLDGRGRLLGATFVMPSTDYYSSFQRVPGNRRGSGDVFRVGWWFEFSIDHRGIVPLGFVLVPHRQSMDVAEHGSESVPVSTGNSETARDLLESERYEPVVSSVSPLLSSAWVGDLHRALWEIERHGSEFSGLALPLLEHPDERLRARAAAVVANDVSRMAAVLPLVEEGSALVRKAARLALLNAPDVAIAQEALVRLLEGDSHEVVHARFDFARLTGREVARQVLDRFQTQLAGGGERAHTRHYCGFLDAQAGRELSPFISSRLIPLLEEATGSVYEDDVMRALERAGVFLFRQVQAELPLDAPLPREAREALMAFLHVCHTRQLSAEGAVGFLMSVRDGDLPGTTGVDRRRAALTLARWNEEDAVAQLAAHFPGPDEFFEEWTALPSHALLLLLIQATESPKEVGERLAEVLRLRPSDDLAPYASRLATLWTAMGKAKASRVDLVWVMARRKDSALDRLLTDELTRPELDEAVVGAVLEAVLERRTPLSDPRAVAACERIRTLERDGARSAKVSLGVSEAPRTAAR